TPPSAQRTARRNSTRDSDAALRQAAGGRAGAAVTPAQGARPPSTSRAALALRQRFRSARLVAHNQRYKAQRSHAHGACASASALPTLPFLPRPPRPSHLLDTALARSIMRLATSLSVALALLASSCPRLSSVLFSTSLSVAASPIPVFADSFLPPPNGDDSIPASSSGDSVGSVLNEVVDPPIPPPDSNQVNVANGDDSVPARSSEQVSDNGNTSNSELQIGGVININDFGL
ncbi:uncharacterized protein BJ171DRAFT_505493, partial [Polychytrium aggregatum]|uniref:uncharacterized protein n=1 Tax=Polychytrium aggregatum TaxID=110093 RepID=UPI0022FE9FAF